MPVILSGGEAGARDRTTVSSAVAADRTTFAAYSAGRSRSQHCWLLGT
jgi:hypothetical protein